MRVRGKKRSLIYFNRGHHWFSVRIFGFMYLPVVYFGLVCRLNRDRKYIQIVSPKVRRMQFYQASNSKSV